MKRIARPLLPARSSMTVFGAGSEIVVRGDIVSSVVDGRNGSPRLRLDRSFGLFLTATGPMSSAI